MEEGIFRVPYFTIFAILTSLIALWHKDLSSLFVLAKWEKPFNLEDASKSFPFLVGKGTTVQVLMMHQVEQFAFGVDRSHLFTYLFCLSF